MKQFCPHLSFSLFAALALSSCSNGVDNNRLRVDVIEDSPRPISIAAMPLPPASAYLRQATAQGLVTFDLQGRVVPALASRWIVTDDGLSYIFRIDKTSWNDGREVNSADVASLLNRRFADLADTRFGPDLGIVDRAVAMTGKVVEIRLHAPMPYLLEMIAQPEFGLVRRNAGSGPMQARKTGGFMQLRMREEDERGQPVLDDATLALNRDKASIVLARYLNGDSDLIVGGRIENFPLAEAARLPGNELIFDPVPGLFGLAFDGSGPFLSESTNREAIAMAIDRPRLLTSFDVQLWQETVTLVPETMASRGTVPRPEWAQLRVSDRQEQARATIMRWQEAHGRIRPLKIALPTGPGARILFAGLRSDLARIGLDAERVSLGADSDLRLIDMVADQSTPAWYLQQLSCRTQSICSEKADQLALQALKAQDIATRTQLLAEAETELQATRNFVPIANPLRWNVARTGLTGFAATPRGWHLLQYLGRDNT